MAVAAQALEDRPQFGILMMLAAWLLFAAVDTSAKWLVLAGLPAVQLAFMRYAGHFLISIVMIAKDGANLSRFQTDHLGAVLTRGLLLVSATLGNFYSLNFLPLTVVSAIMFSSPIIVCLLSITLLKERIGPWRWGAILLGFAGVLIVIRPFGEAFHWATLLILANATGLALFSIMTRQMAGRITPQTMQLYMGALGTVVLLPFALWFWTMPEGALQWVTMVAIGLWAWAGHEMFSRAHLHADANVLSPYGYVFILYVTVGGFLLFGHVPDGATLIGAAIIVASGLLIWWREGKKRVHHAP